MKRLSLTGVALFASLCAASCADQGWYLANPETHPSFAVGPQPMSGMSGQPAAYIRSVRGGAAGEYGTLERSLPLDDWHGKRLRVAFRVRSEGNAYAFVWAEIQKPYGAGIAAATQENPSGNDAWQPHQFVLDVPDDADALVISVELSTGTGTGAAWVDGLKLEAVGNDVALSKSFPTFSVTRSAPAHRNNRPVGGWLDQGEPTPWVLYGGQTFAPSSGPAGNGLPINP